MGVRSFRTGTGRKKLTTEPGILAGHAERFYSTRRTGLSPDRVPVPPGYQIKFRLHAYGSTIGNFYVFWSENNSGGSLQQLDFEYSTDGINYSTVQVLSGQKNASTGSAYHYIKANSPSDTGRFYYIYQLGSNYFGDLGLDNFDIYSPDGNNFLYRIQNIGSNWWTNISAIANFIPGTSTTSHWTFMQIAVQSGVGGKWQIDSFGTPSGSTGPYYDADGALASYIYVEATVSSSRYGAWTALTTQQDLATLVG